jgi:putative ABC transport system permease protein
MIYSLRLAWRNILARPVQALVTVLVMGLAIALFVTVAHLSDAMQRGIIRASDPFGVLVVGAKGSAQQLVMSTLLLQANPVGNIPHRVYAELAGDPRVALAVPIAMGDNVGGARIIGTDASFFQLRPSEQEPPAFQLATGTIFAKDFEAVLGSQAAAGLGLSIGDEFVPAHGVAPGLADDVHDIRHTVVGILRPSQTPYDNAVFTTYASVIHAHAEAGEEEHAEEDHTGESGDERAEETHSEGAHEEDQQITAVLVKPVGFVEQNELWQEFYTGTEAQAAFPGRELGGLFDLLDQAQDLLQWVGYLAAVMAALTLFLAVYSAASARERLLAIMRGLGANRGMVFQVVLFEAVLAALLGALAGRLIGYAVAWVIATQLARQSAIPMTLRYLPALEPFLWALPLVLGVVAGIIPALQAYRVNVVEKLFPA